MNLSLKIFGAILSVILFICAGIYLYLRVSHTDSADPGDTRYRLEEFVNISDTSDFSRVTGPREMVFPDDLQPYPEYRTGWWYYTGNLRSESGRHFGYQLTFFRNSIAPESVQTESGWRTNQIYMAHFAFTDVANNDFYAFERFSRQAVGLAGGQIDPFRVWLEDWNAGQTGAALNYGIPDVRLQAAQSDISLDLTLSSVKPPVLQGDAGYSQKGPEEGNASYYFSLTRLASSGTVTIDGQKYDVTGFSWMDREWSTSALGSDQIGWDWFSIQLSDSTEIMYYQIRNSDGNPSRFSKGAFVRKTGEKLHLSRDDVILSVTGSWESPLGGDYPQGWELEIPGENLSLNIEPYIANQELDVYVRYWEGAVQITGTRNGQPVAGNGYVELTGYAEEGIPGLQ
jgi:predicted secreted hydrolase